VAHEHGTGTGGEVTTVARARDLLAMHGVVDTYLTHGVSSEAPGRDGWEKELSALTGLVADRLTVAGEQSATALAATLGTAVDMLNRHQLFERAPGGDDARQTLPGLVREVSALIEAGNNEAAERFMSDAARQRGA
jgi:hypothetical protein